MGVCGLRPPARSESQRRLANFQQFENFSCNKIVYNWVKYAYCSFISPLVKDLSAFIFRMRVKDHFDNASLLYIRVTVHFINLTCCGIMRVGLSLPQIRQQYRPCVCNKFLYHIIIHLCGLNYQAQRILVLATNACHMHIMHYIDLNKYLQNKFGLLRRKQMVHTKESGNG